VDRLLEARGAPPMPWTAGVLDQVRRAEPSTLIQFPVVRANTLEECVNVAVREASLLVTLQLFVLLLGEATRERRSEFRYVRLWSLLETVARSRGCAGRPKRDWSGQIQISKNGPLLVQGAAEQVYELLREVLVPRRIGEQSFASGLTYGSLQEQIPIWYQRRNCTAHGDPGCVCRNPSNAGTADTRHAKCYRARSDDHNGRDGYMFALEQVAKIAVFALLREHWA
jgi:hypothetical protein